MVRGEQPDSALRRLLDRDAVRALAGDLYFERGQRYAAEGRVRAVDEDETTIASTVSGSHDYEVRIWVEDDELEFACDCPIGVDGAFCKHLVALAITALDQPVGRLNAGTFVAGAPLNRPRPITLTDVRAYLDAQDHGTLVDMILAQADGDERLRQRLLINTGLAATAGADTGQIRRAIDQAARVHGFIHYAEAYHYARGIHDAVDVVEGLLRDGQPTAVIELCEHALHLIACRAAKPDPEELAARLFAWELTSEWDVFHGVAETYGEGSRRGRSGDLPAAGRSRMGHGAGAGTRVGDAPLLRDAATPDHLHHGVVGAVSR